MNEYERLHRLSVRIKEQYPPGTRILLHQMDDPYQPVESGTKGTVVCVDDQAQIHMKWDNGRTLALNVEHDSFRKLTQKEIVEEMQPQRVIDFGDDCQIALSDEPIDCSNLGYFDELEYECWNLVKQYCAHFGIEILPDENGEEPINFYITKQLQDKILEGLQEAGVQFKFEEQTEDESEGIDDGGNQGFVPKM